MLMKLTQVVDSTNISHATFFTDVCLLKKIINTNSNDKNLVKTLLYKKNAACKMSMTQER